MTKQYKPYTKGGSLKLYKSYSFKDKDPIIDQMRTMISDEGLTYTEIEKNSGVSAHTLYGWFSGVTKRPQHATVMAVIRSAGYDLKLVSPSGKHVMKVPSLNLKKNIVKKLKKPVQQSRKTA